MDDHFCEIVPSPEQLELLKGPKTINSLKTADFLGEQGYINDWIMDWTQKNEYFDLPLCVEESIITDKKMRKHYNCYVKAAIVSRDLDWMKSHYIVAYNRAWNYVQFEFVSVQMFQLLWSLGPVPLELVSFVAAARRMELWIPFLSHYDPTNCLETVLKQQWAEGVRSCIQEGADLTTKDFLRDGLLMSPSIVRLIIEARPLVTAEAFSDFLLWKRIHRIQDVPLIEEFFWINGFRETGTSE